MWFMGIMKKERLFEIDILRAICAIGIITYHYACSANAQLKILFRNANGEWGYIFVVIFFIISGAMLEYNYGSSFSLKKYYFSRFKAIFPAFYIIYGFFFLTMALQTGKFFFAAPEVKPWKLILSLAGLDGYLSFGRLGISSYYLIGDWFLGALILLYLIYPILAKLIKKCWFVVFGVLLAGYIAISLTGWVDYHRQRVFITCVFSFSQGIIFMKFRNVFDRMIVAILAGAAGLILCFVKINADEVVVRQIMAPLFFIAFMYFGKYTAKNRPVMAIVNSIAAVSFSSFLLQHRFIYIFLDTWNSESIPVSLGFMVICILLILLFAKAADILAKSITTSKAFKKAEEKITN